MRSKAPRGDKGETHAAQGTQSGRQVAAQGTQPKARRVGDKGETSAQGTQGGKQGGDKCKLMRPKAPRVGDKGESSVNSCGPRHPEWETRGDKCKLTRPKAPRVGDEETSVQGTQSGRQGGVKCKLMRPKAPRVGDKGEISVNSCGPRHPE